MLFITHIMYLTLILIISTIYTYILRFVNDIFNPIANLLFNVVLHTRSQSYELYLSTNGLWHDLATITCLILPTTDIDSYSLLSINQIRSLKEIQLYVFNRSDSTTIIISADDRDTLSIRLPQRIVLAIYGTYD